MDRRQFGSLSGCSLATVLWLAQAKAHALSLGDLSNTEASQGLKTALEKGAIAAVNLLGTTDGFLGNEKVRIPLPGFLEDAAKLLKTLQRCEPCEDGRSFLLCREIPQLALAPKWRIGNVQPSHRPRSLRRYSG